MFNLNGPMTNYECSRKNRVIVSFFALSFSMVTAVGNIYERSRLEEM